MIGRDDINRTACQCLSRGLQHSAQVLSASRATAQGAMQQPAVHRGAARYRILHHARRIESVIDPITRGQDR
jgi:hypothetical protein